MRLTIQALEHQDNHITAAEGRLLAEESVTLQPFIKEGERVLDSSGPVKLKDELRHDLLEFDLEDMEDSHHTVLVLETNSATPVAVEVMYHDLGPLGRAQVWLGLVFLVGIFALIITEVIHRTLCSSIGAFVVIVVLAAEGRMPELRTIMTWMDHGTLALLFAMMLLVNVIAKTGVFENVAIKLFKVQGGSGITPCKQ